MDLQRLESSKNFPYGFKGVNFPSYQSPKDSMTLDFPREEEIDLNRQMGFGYSNAPFEQRVKMPWSFHPMGDGKESQDAERNSSGRHTKLCSRGHWRPHEDSKLKELVAQFGPQNWNLIAEKLEGRSGKSCRLRWFNQLDPRINKRAFTAEEEERLLAAHRMYGKKWAMISKLFPGRTDNAVKNHWHVIMARKYREENTVYRRRKQPSNFQSCPKGFSANTQQNSACNESNISSNNVDETASTCTNLSLTPSTKGSVDFFTSFGSAEEHHFFGPHLNQMVSGDDAKMKKRSAVDDYQFNSNWPVAKAAVINPSVQSDTCSEVSASESVANDTNTKLHRMHDKINKGSEDSKLPFIDFLGVGAT